MIEKLKQHKKSILIVVVSVVIIVTGYVLFFYNLDHQKDTSLDKDTGISPTDSGMMSEMPLIEGTGDDVVSYMESGQITDELDDKISDKMNDIIDMHLGNIQPDQLTTGLVESMLGEMIVTYPVNLLQDPQFIIKEVKNYSYKKKTTYAVKTQYKQDVNLEITLSGEFLEDFRFAIISGSSTTYLYGGVKNLIEKKYGSESDNIDDVIITRFLKVGSVLDVKRIFEGYVVGKLEDGKDHKIESIGSVRTSYSLPTHRVVIEYLRKDKPLVGNEFVKHKMTYIKEFQKDSMGEWNGGRSISKERMYSERQRKVIEQEEESHAEKMQLQLQGLQRDFIACKTNRYSVDTGFGPRYAIVIQGVEQGKCKVDHYYIAASKEEEKNDDIFTKKMTCMYDIGQGALSYQEQAQNMMANDWNNCVGSLADFFRGN